MTDREIWNEAVAVVRDCYLLLPAYQKILVSDVIRSIKKCKEDLYRVTAGIGSAEICLDCGGECCRTGKYHFTGIDLLAYLADAQELFDPMFGQQACPYLGTGGCMMPPENRPYNCVIFNCDMVEALSGQAERERMAELERELRTLYHRFGECFGPELTKGLLMAFDHNPCLPTGLFPRG
jgi:hypothetical protein